jgi:long-chain fatty acid transport protein
MLKKVAQIGMLGLGMIAGTASATNGYFAHGYGTQSKGMAGAGVALALDSLAPATNPAAVALETARTDLGLGFFSPIRSYTSTGTPTGACASAQECTFGIGPQSIDSGNELFLIPHFGMTWALGERSALGLAVYGNGGMNTNYEGGTATFGAPVGTVPPGTSFTAPGTYGAGDTGVDLTQLFIAPTYAYRFGKAAALGVTPILAVQQFRAKGLGNFAPFSSDAANLSNNGYDSSYGGGLRLGVQGAVTDYLRLGASWQSRIYMTEFDKYAGLFAEQGDFDIPSNFTVGLAVQAAALMVAFDVQHIAYGEVDSIGNSMLPNLGQARLGDDNGAGFGWEDMTIYKLGLAWQQNTQRTWRFGYSYGEQPIPESEVLFNILAPGVVEQHITAGVTQKVSGNNEWSVALMFAPNKSVKGQNPLDPAQTIEIEMHQFELEFSYGWGG